MVSVDLNCDMGESFGNWSMGNDAGVMPYITSTNIAGGFHAGDPHVMRKTVSLAVEHGVGIGVHPGLPDKIGFGRRTMDAPPDALRDYVVYQLGALEAFARAAGTTIQHVKPHGAMYTMISEEKDHARAVMEGVLDVDPALVFIATDRRIYEVAQEFDELRAVFEANADTEYRSDGSVIVEQQKQPKDPDQVGERFVNLALENRAKAIDGDWLEMPAQSICVHGDGPNVIELLKEIHERAEEHDIELVSVSEIV
jgi:UPF0271 protein